MLEMRVGNGKKASGEKCGMAGIDIVGYRVPIAKKFDSKRSMHGRR